jgi:2-polyprenyl-3-methyl-5-hydroxy-6-metoxy-1,4-benzoquinol methylase
METCPYCNNFAAREFTVYSRTYHCCLSCDLIYQAPLKYYDDVVAIYRKNYFIEHSADQTGGNRNTLFDHALDLIETKKRIGKLLDVGTGCGFFLIAAWERGWQVKGVEPSIQSVELAQEEYGLDVFNGTLRDYNDDSQFDVITFNNVLEHSVLPWQEIALANKLLQPGGLVYLRFPNGLLHSQVCLAARKCGLGNSLSKFLVFHVYSFTPIFMRRLLRDHGFGQITIKNSPPSEGDPNKLFINPILSTHLKRLLHLLAQSAQVLSSGQWLFGSSLEAIAVKRGDNYSE